MFLKSPFFIFSALCIVVIAFLIKNDILEVKFSLKKFSKLLKKKSSPVTDTGSTSTASKSDAPDLLKDHSNLFNKPEIVKVAEGVYSAIGFGLANCLLFDDGTDDGLVMVDAMESEEAMRDVLIGFEKQHNILIEHAEAPADPKQRRRRITTLIYTHNHQDHTMGTKYANPKNIVAYDLTRKLLTHSPVVGPITYRRGMRQFGVYAPEESFINSGIGPELRVGEKKDKDKHDGHGHRQHSGDFYTSRLVLPTQTFTTPSHNISVGTRWKMTLYHCPGETPDQIVIHVPELDLLVASDNIYQSFANIYAIRGTPSRDATLWAKCLGDTMRGLRSKVMVPLHTRPVYGQQEIFDLLTDYRDAIQFVHDQTVFHMNRGLFPDQIVRKLKLPKHLETHPWLQPFYGTVEWGSKSVFSHYLGWFGGDAKDLSPSKPGSLAQEISLRCSSPEAIVKRAQELLEKSHLASATSDQNRENAQLALELSSLVIDGREAETKLNEKQQQEGDAPLTKAKEIRRKSLSRLASLSIAATGRNYYTTYSLELDNELDLKIPQSYITNNLQQIDSGYNLLNAMAVNLDFEETEGVDWLVEFKFTDTNEHLMFHVRKGVVDIFDGVKKEKLISRKSGLVDLEIVTKRKSWVDVMTKERSPVVMLATKEIEIKVGGISEMSKFTSYFSSPRD